MSSWCLRSSVSVNCFMREEPTMALGSSMNGGMSRLKPLKGGTMEDMEDEELWEEPGTYWEEEKQPRAATCPLK